MLNRTHAICLILCLLWVQISSLTADQTTQSRSALDATDLGIQTVLIHGTNFVMGTGITSKKDAQYHPDEARMRVAVGDFRIGKVPITAEQMCAFLNSPDASQHVISDLYYAGTVGGRQYSTIVVKDGKYVPAPGITNAPANQVTWKGAVLFCQWLSSQTSKKYRLPTEAEWEFVARGKEGRKYPWGEDANEKHGPRYASENPQRKRPGSRVSVGSYPANATPEGVLDMCAYIIGEWCVNKYVAHPTPENVTDNDADLKDLQTRRVVRGYYMRQNSRSLPVPLGVEGYHVGCAWTREGSHPIDAAKHAARHGFRVVEEQTENDQGRVSPLDKSHP
jgi:formylglycine-generating enzyme required for sulfatase activity